MNETIENVRKETKRSKVKVDSLIEGEFQKAGTITAMFRQKVVTDSFYPSAVHSSDMQKNLFTKEQFGEEEQQFTATENRVAFMDVPVIHPESGNETTVADVKALVGKKACLYRILSNAPILSNNHLSAIQRNVTTKAKIAKGQVVRYGADHEDAGELVKDPAGRVQYRKVFFSNEPKKDEDYRGDEAHAEYIYPELAEELNVDVKTGEVMTLETEEMVKDEEVMA